MAVSKQKTIERVEKVTFDLYPIPTQHTNHFQLGFDEKDVRYSFYHRKASKLEYFDYMIKLLGGEENIKAVQFNKDSQYWEVTLNKVMNMYKAKEALEQIEEQEPYIDPTTKIQEERNYFLFREPLLGECRLYANLLQGDSEGIAVVKTEKDFSELMGEWKIFFDSSQYQNNQVD